VSKLLRNSIKITASASNGTLPDSGYAPPGSNQGISSFQVVGPITFEFLLPEIGASTWQPEQAAIMTVPVAAMNKNCCMISRKNNIRRSRKGLDI